MLTKSGLGRQPVLQAIEKANAAGEVKKIYRLVSKNHIIQTGETAKQPYYKQARTTIVNTRVSCRGSS